MERFKFYSRSRRPGESVANFIAQLKSLEKHCNYGASLENMLRDRLVCGINDDSIQKCLLAESNLTDKKAVEIVRGLETADMHVKLLKKNPTVKREQGQSGHEVHCSSEVHHVTPPKSVQEGVSSLTFFRCGKTGHIATHYKFTRDIVCHGCGKVGHLQKTCRSSGQRGTGPKNNRVRQVSRVEEKDEFEEEVDEAALFQITSETKVPPIELQVQIDDCQVRMDVDTVTTMSFMPAETFHSLWPGRRVETTKVRLCAYSKEPIPILGRCNVNIEYKCQTAVEVPLIVVSGSGPTLLGRNWLSHIQLNWQEIRMLTMILYSLC